MKNLMDHLSSALRTSLGHPARVEEWAAGIHKMSKQPMYLTSSTIRTTDVVRWDRLGECEHAQELGTTDRGVLRGWGLGPTGSYESIEQKSAPLKNLIVETTTKDWVCDIQDVQGLSASKSDLGRYDTMESFATENCTGLLDEPSAKAINENMAWYEVRITDPAGPDHFCRYDWDGRAFLVNSGGSHHFAAARQMAQEIGQAVPLTGRLKTYGFNQPAVASLRQHFEMFAVPSDPVLENEFWDGMKAAGASYFPLPLPSEFYSAPMKAILLPRSDPQSMKVAKILRTAGFWNVGQSLSELAMGAHRHRSSLLPRAPLPPAIPGALGGHAPSLPTPSALVGVLPPLEGRPPPRRGSSFI